MTSTRPQLKQSLLRSKRQIRTLSAIATAGVALALGFSPMATAAEIRVDLSSPPDQGSIVLMLFDSANAFGDFRDPVRKEVFSTNGITSFSLEQVPAGEYALVVHHDINSDGVLDKSFIGIPTEPLAFSNGYRPKGPPSYQRARFTLADGQTVVMELDLFRALGRRGRLGVGIGVIGRSSPYRDYSGEVAQVIPAVTYNGNRIQALGTTLKVGIVGKGKLRLAATGSYRIGVYEEGDSPYLEGMGDRDSTLMAGLGLQYELPKGFDVALGIETDVLDRIGGTEARLRLDKSFQIGIARFVPNFSLNWQSSALANYDYGVAPDQALPERPEYELEDILSLEAGLGSFVEITRDWRIVLNVAVEFFDDEVSDSPIVVEDSVIKGFIALNYVF